eukprot:TRINITY_DN13493_c0_g1_i2.p1 TRINITY_DN13493_c0_g1~~TRINITY_DN13493_c0_g1_i2.p1  ORF type:complete len:745 (+),score=165.11 TRINITY_DN13493_c0_g1_i2:43-2277(+)
MLSDVALPVDEVARSDNVEPGAKARETSRGSPERPRARVRRVTWGSSASVFGDGGARAGGGDSLRETRAVGVLGGAFNPIHLGHVLLAVTVREAKPVDEVVIVPVFQHPVKTDLLPYEDRLAMCKLAVQGKGVQVSDVERETRESNVAMLRALRAKYPRRVQLFWVCGDDVFDWIDNEKGSAMMEELDGLIVQRRLHRAHEDGGEDRFFKSPVDAARIAALSERHGVRIDLIVGELPHFSSTLVRSLPESWKAYLPRSVATYLDTRPHLLQQLKAEARRKCCGPAAISSGSNASLTSPSLPRGPEDLAAAKTSAPAGNGSTAEATPPQGLPRRTMSTTSASSIVEAIEQEVHCVLRCLALVHGIQRERSRSALALALNDEEAAASALLSVRAEVDDLLRDTAGTSPVSEAAHDLTEELAHASVWLTRDRLALDRYLQQRREQCDAEADRHHDGAAAWLRRVTLLRRFGARVDSLVEACLQVLSARVAAAAAAPAHRVAVGAGASDAKAVAKRQLRSTEAGGEQEAADDSSTSETCEADAEVWSSGGEDDFDEVAESSSDRLLRLLSLWAHGKEALGRERAFICAGGRKVSLLLRGSLRLRTLLAETIEMKDMALKRIFAAERRCPSLGQRSTNTVADALHRMLVRVTALEWSLMGCFATSTPLAVQHRILAVQAARSARVSPATESFEVDDWFRTTSSAVDLMATLVQSLVAGLSVSLASASGASISGNNNNNAAVGTAAGGGA